MPTTPVNLSLLRHVFAAQLPKRIPYRLGGKAPTLGASPAQLASGIDCSGESRLLLFQATGGALTLPDGSWNQREWAEQNLQEVPYSQALHANENELFIAFITAHVNSAGGVGHVWLVEGQPAGQDNTTLESYGGHGIGSRPANTGVLVRQVHKCFRLPTTAQTPTDPPILRTTAAPPPAPSAAPSAAPALFLNDTEIQTARLENGHYLALVRDILRALQLAYAPDPKQTTPSQFRLKVWKK